MSPLRTSAFSVVAAFAAATVFAAAPQADAKDFYSGKQIKLIVGSSPGGGYDTYARTIAQHMGNHLAGNPPIIVQNMPGASSRKAADYLYAVAPKDGTVIGAVFSGIPSDPLINPGLVKFDVKKFNWLGSASSETFVGYVWHTSPVQTLDALKTKEMIVGASGGATHDFPALANAILGLHFKIVSGYKGTKEINLAMERGELQGNAGNTWTSLKTQHQDWLKKNEVKVFVQYGSKPNPELKNVPLMLSLAKNKADYQALNLSFSRGDAQRPYVAPPGLPKSRVKMLRQAFADTMKDKAFLANAEKRHLVIDYVSPKQIEGLIDGLYETPKSVVDRVRSVLAVKKK